MLPSGKKNTLVWYLRHLFFWEQIKKLKNQGYNDKKEIFVKTSKENYKFMHINILLL